MFAFLIRQRLNKLVYLFCCPICISGIYSPIYADKSSDDADAPVAVSVSLYFAKLIGKILRFPSATAKTQVNQANDLEMLSVVGG